MNPTALADQLQAATRDANAAINARGKTWQAEPDSVPWAADQIATLRLAFLSGQARCCPHLGPSPQIAYAAAWKPGQLVCTRCQWMLSATPAEDATCDRCRKPRCSPIYAGMIQTGPIILAYGLCKPCLTQTGLHGAPDHAP